MAEKIDRKQLKRPDEFQVVAGKAMQWVATHQKPVVAGLGLAAALVAIVWGVSLWKNSREAKAGAELAQALELQSRPIAGEGQSAPGQETFPSKEEREKAVLAALEKVRADHGGTAAAQTAVAELGFHKLKSGDGAGAQKDLEEFLRSAPRGHPLRAFAQESLAYALEAQNKLDEARAEFDRLRDYDMAARGEYHVARLALVQGKPEAKAQLEKIAKEYPKEMDVVREAYERLELASIPPATPGKR